MVIVSIIIPVFNRKDLVEEMIKSILIQTYKYWELVLVDDGSDDETLDMMIDYSQKEKRINLIKRNRLPKGGQTCRNIGMNKASGKYIIFFDSDDLISPTCLEKRVNFMENNKSIDFGIFRARSFHDFSNVINNSFCSKDYTFGVEIMQNPISNLLKGQYPFVVCTNIYKKEIKEIGLFWDENMSVLQDLDFNLSTLYKGLKFKYSIYSDFDYFVRISPNHNSVSSNLSSDLKYNSAKYFISKTYTRISTLPDSKKLINDFWGFILFYYNGIIHDKIKVNNYLTFCKEYFPTIKIIKLKCIILITTTFYKSKYYRKINLLLLYILFPYYFLPSIKANIRNALSWSEKIYAMICSNKIIHNSIL